MFSRSGSNAGIRINAPKQRRAKTSSGSKQPTPAVTPSVSPHVSDSEDYPHPSLSTTFDNLAVSAEDSWRGVGAGRHIPVLSADALAGKISEQLDLLGEKRSAVREDAFRQLTSLLSRYCASEALEGMRDTLLDAFLRVVKRDKSTSESVAAAKLVGLWFITLGASLSPPRGARVVVGSAFNPDDPGQKAYDEAASVLKTIAESSKAPTVKAACLQALGVANFVASHNPADADAALAACSDALKPQTPNADVAVAALNTFGLVYSSLDADSDTAKDQYESTVDKHIALLGHPSADVRIAAGENIALMYSILRSATNKRALHRHTRHAPLVEALHSLSSESSKSVSKRDRIHQRSAFRDITATVEDSEAPNLSFKIRTRTITITDWRLVVQLYALRELLNEGFHVHFFGNEFLHEIFGVGFDGLSTGGDAGDGSSGATSTERYVVDPSSDLAKARTMAGRKQRTQKLKELEFDDDY
ncbi:hypothetical protein GQ42DRAFT_162009 [Ramicandelaber brevisporus]|nr:hypothetical protein GQ42DRAFT_162009 [Ramicandelaber brevisporus]